MEHEEVARNEEIAWSKGPEFNDVEGETITNPTVKENIRNFYLNLNKESKNSRHDFNLHETLGITNVEKERLQRQFEEEEVLNVIKLCASDKAPGPVGHPMCFY
ncbi:hypothetical protein H5410_045943 [Solanum commersonii]|uniref:Uncharacterized protein n=1 Tax=Solanum commersonii TaxID=4109 RepID=A0A9J5XCZ9_SOLCO|nr:hypothetical protein H5410_045943 [Solanum commersonii]